MTTLVAWIAIDSQAPSALYLASDSRISWSGTSARWDAGRKLFFCRNHPDLFGYSGDVLFPALALGQLTEAADASLLFSAGSDAASRHDAVVSVLRASFEQRHQAPTASFSVLHASRDGRGSRARFRLWLTSYSAATSSWLDREEVVSMQGSQLLIALGSGAASLAAHADRWGRSDQGGTSRAIFSAFCDLIKSADDPATGGVAQLVGMYHTRMPQAFGFVRGGQRYLHGLPLPAGNEEDTIEWRDELFQRLDGKSLTVRKGAQRHMRPRSV